MSRRFLKLLGQPPLVSNPGEKSGIHITKDVVVRDNLMVFNELADYVLEAAIRFSETIWKHSRRGDF